MSLMTYQQTGPRAKAIRQAVQTKNMPPWCADPHYGKISRTGTTPGFLNLFSLFAIECDRFSQDNGT